MNINESGAYEREVEQNWAASFAKRLVADLEKKHDNDKSVIDSALEDLGDEVDQCATKTQLEDYATLSDLADEAEARAAKDNVLADGTGLENNCIYSRHIREGNVTTGKIHDLNVTEAKLADGAVTEAKLADGAVTEAKLDDGAVTEAKLSNAFKLPLHKLVTVLSGSQSSPIDLNVLEDGIYSFHSAGNIYFENLPPFVGGTLLIQITNRLLSTTSGSTISQYAFPDNSKVWYFRYGNYDTNTGQFTWTDWG